MKNSMLAVFVSAAFFSFILLGFGFAFGMNSLLYPKGGSELPELNPDKASQDVHDLQKLTIVGLGDSLTRGIGDAEGLGYIDRVERLLQEKWGTEVTNINLAVSGADTEDLLQLLEQSGVQYSISRADLILMTMGANDLFPGWDKLGMINLSTYTGDRETFRKRVNQILNTIRKYNKNAPVFWLGLYNPFEDIEALEGGSSVIHRWNFILNNAASTHSNVFVIPTFDLFLGETESYLYTDHFHPNKKGYIAIAERVVRKIAAVFDLKKG